MPQAHPDLQVNMAFRAPKVTRVPRGTWAHQDRWGRKDHLDSGARQAPQELLGTLDLPV